MRSKNEMESTTDWTALRQGDARAVERWFRDHADPLYTFVFQRLGRDRDLARDVVQETFLTALQQIDRFDPQRGAMMTWLTYIARNAMRTALRRRGRQADFDAWEQLESGLQSSYAELALTPLPQEVLERQETVELVRLTLTSIPGNYRAALLQHHCQQKTLREIGASLGISDKAAKSMLHRARLAFRRAFEAFARNNTGPAASQGE
jgi:RNA polymerase sigma-70 factor, ECF subfamily